jgi:hypothetical protein
MPLGPQFALIHSKFNEFLFASVGEEKNGAPLSVLSALTRLGFDPWGEAARLSGLPKETAARALAAAIALLPEGNWNVSDASAIAARLVDRLPAHAAFATQSRPSDSGTHRKVKVKRATMIWLICLTFAVATILAVLQLGADHSPDPAPTAIPSTQH